MLRLGLTSTIRSLATGVNARRALAAATLIVVLACCATAAAHADTSPHSIAGLLCNGRLTTVNYAVPEFIELQRVALADSRLSIIIAYGLSKPSGGSKLSDLAGFAYRLDRGRLTTIRPLSGVAPSLIELSFNGLEPGKHVFTVGNALPSGDFEFSNSLCFRTPGGFTLRGDLYL